MERRVSEGLIGFSPIHALSTAIKLTPTIRFCNGYGEFINYGKNSQ